MCFGFGVLGLSSRDFWAMTPRELSAAAEAIFGTATAPLDRTVLDALIVRYPDAPRPTGSVGRADVR